MNQEDVTPLGKVVQDAEEQAFAEGMQEYYKKSATGKTIVETQNRENSK